MQGDARFGDSQTRAEPLSCAVVKLFSALLALACAALLWAEEADRRFPFFEYLTAEPSPKMVCYFPSELDPRTEANNRALATNSLRKDLEALRPYFDGLVLYGYHEASTPRILALAQDLKFRAVLLGIWDPKSAGETDGVATLVALHAADFALAVCIGNEGVTHGRYEPEDIVIAAARLRSRLARTVPLTTSEPLVGYRQKFARDFGDFLAPNIHPVFDRPQLDAVAAAAWAREQAARLARQSGKPVLLKETGFPHGGKEPHTPETQREFWRAYLEAGILARLDAPTLWSYYGVAFEAFDLPWKTAETGLAVEKHWGLFNIQRQPYPALEAWRARLQR